MLVGLNAGPPPKKPHFAVFLADEIKQKQHNQIPKNTLKSERNADMIFRNYLEEQLGISNYNYWVYPDEELDHILVHFWFSLRKQGGKKYTIASLQNIKNALIRQLQRKGRYLDISKDICYVNSQRAFRDACHELRTEGLGHVKSYPEIEEKGILPSYSHSVNKCMYKHRILQDFQFFIWDLP